MKRVILFLISALIFYSAYGVAEFYVTRYFSDGQEETKRLVNIRNFREGVRAVPIKELARKVKSDERARVVIIGDSQTYGHRIPYNLSLGAALEEVIDGNVYNFSIVDGRYGDAIKVIDILHKTGVRVDYIVMNINPSHAARRASYPECVHFCRDSFVPLGSFSYLLGLSENDFHGFSFKDVDSFSYSIRDNYYVDLDAEYLAGELGGILSYIDNSGVSDKVITFTSPNQGALFNEEPYQYGFYTDEVLDQALGVCKSFSFSICLDYRNLTEIGMHFDIIHLNSKGNRELARSIYHDVFR